jgi:hypothetical protein
VDEMKTELLVIEQSGFELEPFFTKGTGIDEILNKLETEIMAHVPDVSTVKGRGEITANISKAKVYRLHLFDCRKKLSAEYKLIPSTIDKHGKKVNDFLLNIEAKARIQLTEWEVEDKAKKERAALLVKIEQKHDDANIENELFDLKAKQAEADRQAEIKAASEKAAAEAKAQAEAEAAERIAQAEREKIAAEQREIAAKQAVIDAENKAAQDAIDAKAREEKAKQDAIDAQGRARYEAEQAEQRRIFAEQQAKRDAEVAAENARKCEIRKQEVEAHQAKVDKEAREANKRHVNGIKTKAMNDFISCGLDDASARLAVKALAAGKISNAGISY